MYTVYVYMDNEWVFFITQGSIQLINFCIIINITNIQYMAYKLAQYSRETNDQVAEY